MPDPYRKVSPGDDLDITAIAWNDFLTKSRIVDEIKGKPPSSPSPSLRQAAIIKVVNESEDDRPRGSVLGLGSPIFTPGDTDVDAFAREVTFRGQKPDITKHKRRFCVLLDPAPMGVVVRAYVAGVCPVKVDVKHTHHEYATITDNDTEVLTSSRYGFAQILWSESDDGGGYGYGYGYGYDTGVQWAIVRLGAHCPNSAVGKAAGSITARSGSTFGTGSVDLYRADADGNIDGPLETVEDVRNPGDAISSGKWVAVEWDMESVPFVGPLECE